MGEHIICEEMGFMSLGGEREQIICEVMDFVVYGFRGRTDYLRGDGCAIKKDTL